MGFCDPVGRQAASSSLSGVLSHDRNIAVGLIGDHFPAPCEAGQNRGFGSALGQKHQTVTFIGLGSAPVCRGHCNCLHPATSLLALAADVPERSGEAGDEVVYPGGFPLRLSLSYRFVVKNLAVASDLNLLWRSHVMMFLRWEGNLLR
jgi:hypothetical protein